MTAGTGIGNAIAKGLVDLTAVRSPELASRRVRMVVRSGPAQPLQPTRDQRPPESRNQYRGNPHGMTSIDEAAPGVRRGEMVLVANDEDRETRAIHNGSRVGDAESIKLNAVGRGLVLLLSRRTGSTSSEVGPMGPTASSDARPRRLRSKIPALRAAASVRPTARARSERDRSSLAPGDFASRPCVTCGPDVEDWLEPAWTHGGRGRLAVLGDAAPVAVICEVLHDDG